MKKKKRKRKDNWIENNLKNIAKLKRLLPTFLNSNFNTIFSITV